MVNSLAQTNHPLDPYQYTPMIDSLTIDVSMDIIVFGDVDHPRHRQRTTFVNVEASDCPLAPNFQEDACPSSESWIDNFADMSPLVPIKLRRVANLSKPLFIEDSEWAVKPFHSSSSPSLSPSELSAKKIQWRSIPACS